MDANAIGFISFEGSLLPSFARFQLTQRVARSLSDSWASCFNLAQLLASTDVTTC